MLRVAGDCVFGATRFLLAGPAIDSGAATVGLSFAAPGAPELVVDLGLEEESVTGSRLLSRLLVSLCRSFGSLSKSCRLVLRF